MQVTVISCASMIAEWKCCDFAKTVGKIGGMQFLRLHSAKSAVPADEKPSVGSPLRLSVVMVDHGCSLKLRVTKNPSFEIKDVGII